MKVTIKEPEIVYPCLMTSENKNIILATGKDTNGNYLGICLKHHYIDKPSYYYKEITGGWLNFKPYNEEFVIKPSKDFPKVMITKDKKTIILATAYDDFSITGICLKLENGFIDYWNKHITEWSKPSFEPLNADLVLQND